MSVIDIVLLVAMRPLRHHRLAPGPGVRPAVPRRVPHRGGRRAVARAPWCVDSWADGTAQRARRARDRVPAAPLSARSLVGMVGRRLQGAVTWGPMVKLNNVGGAVLSVLHHDARRSGSCAGVYATRQLQLAGARRPSVAGHRRLRRADAGRARSSSAARSSRCTTTPGSRRCSPASAPSRSSRSVRPNAAIVRREAVVEAAAQTVKILGEAPSCSSGLEGSGFAFAPERVLTNAHVLAGVRIVSRWSPQDGSTVVRRDRRLLRPRHGPRRARRSRAARRPAHVLRLTSTAATSVAVLGYPENGGLAGDTGARPRRDRRARGNDIYGDGTVVREVLSLRADVRPGNSGGPVVNRVR